MKNAPKAGIGAGAGAGAPKAAAKADPYGKYCAYCQAPEGTTVKHK